MSVYKPKGRKEYVYDFWLNGRRFHGNTEKSERREALKVEEATKEASKEAIKQGNGKTAGLLTLDLAIGRYWLEWGQHQKNADDLKSSFARIVEFFEALDSEHFRPSGKGKDRPLSNITDDDIAKLVAWRRGHRVIRRYKNQNDPRARTQPLITPAQVNRTTIQILRRLFVRARRCWKIRYDSEPNWSVHLLEEPEERVRELRKDEDAALQAKMDPDYEAVRRFSLASGLRREENLLRWPQVDLKGGRITRKGKGGRQIFLPITSEMREILLSCIGHHPEYVFTYVCRHPSRSPVRVLGVRYPITAGGLETHWRRRRAAAGVKDFRWHDNRHTFATQLLRETKNLKLVQRGMNHRNVATTAKYAHVLDEDLLAGMEAASQKRRDESQQNSQRQKKRQRNQC